MYKDIKVKAFCPLMNKEETVYFICFPDKAYRFNGCDQYRVCEECKRCSASCAEKVKALHPELQVH